MHVLSVGIVWKVGKTCSLNVPSLEGFGGGLWGCVGPCNSCNLGRNHKMGSDNLKGWGSCRVEVGIFD